MTVKTPPLVIKSSLCTDEHPFMVLVDEWWGWGFTLPHWRFASGSSSKKLWTCTDHAAEDPMKDVLFNASASVQTYTALWKKRNMRHVVLEVKPRTFLLWGGAAEFACFPPPEELLILQDLCVHVCVDDLLHLYGGSQLCKLCACSGRRREQRASFRNSKPSPYLTFFSHVRQSSSSASDAAPKRRTTAWFSLHI